MFRKLKLQFIFTNLIIITALFISLTMGAYILLQINMINHAKIFARNLAMGINSGGFPEFPAGNDQRPPSDNNRPPEPSGVPMPPGSPVHPGPPKPPPNKGGPSPNFFYVKTNPAGSISFQSLKQPSGKVSFAVPVRQILKGNQESGIINFFHSKYFYYRTPLRKQPGTLIIFLDLKQEQEKNIQQTLVRSLIITGIIYLVLSLAGSLFMANRAIGPIQKAWRQQKDFLADASHELRTPLAIIQTNLEVVLSNTEETVASQIEWLNNMRDELQQMTVLVSSLLFLARVDSRQNLTEKTYFSLSKVADRVSEAFKALISAKNITLDKAIENEITYYGDESNIRQVIEILFDNALQHTPAGGKISLTLSKSDKRIILTVADTGEGIAAGHLEKIFDRFYQVDASRSKGKAGLGLSIAKCIIENHGGTIGVSSTPGSGTVFTIRLPLLKDNIIVNMENRTGARQQLKRE